MLPEAKECKQCGWDVSLNAPPTTDPGDRKARIGVAAGLVVAYALLWSLVQSAPAEDLSMRPRAHASAEPVNETAAEAAPEPVAQAPVALGTAPTVVASVGTATKPSALISIKVADVKNAPVPAREALQYAFEVPETELARVRSELPERMTSVAALSVPLVVDVGAAPNWEQAH